MPLRITFLFPDKVIIAYIGSGTMNDDQQWIPPALISHGTHALQIFANMPPENERHHLTSFEEYD